jgi:hypothetical protein
MHPQMKIVFANRYVFPDQSATNRMVSGLAFALARRGFKVTAIASRALHDHSDVTLSADEMVADSTVKRLWATRFGRSNILGRAIDYLTFHISAFLWCLWNLKRDDICVVCTDPPLLSVTTSLPIRWRRARMVNWVMDLLPEVAVELGMLSNKSIPGTISRSMRNWSMRKSAMIVCPTATMASYLSDRGFLDGQVFVMHHSSDGKEIYPVAPAFSQSVELRGIVPRSEMAKEYEWAGVFPLPSISEGSATAIYEALAAGLPVICTENAGGVVRDGVEGFIVPICNGEAIAKAIADLTEHPGLRAAMSESAVDRAAEFTLKRYGERLLDALSVLQAQRRTPTEQAA